MQTKFSHFKPMDEKNIHWVLQTEKELFNTPWSLQAFQSCLKNGINFISCDINGDFLGYICLLPILDELELLNFCVAKKHQSKGIGRESLNNLLDYFKNTPYIKIKLEVRESNKTAINLYSANGFKIVGKRPNYYTGNNTSETALLMDLILK